MSVIVGKSISAGGGGSNMNIFASETKPDAQNGLWIKRAKSEVSKVLIKSDYYLADGEATRGNGTFTNVTTGSYVGRAFQNCIAVGKIVYTFGGNYYNVYANGESFAYDTENDVFTNLPSYTVVAIGATNNSSYNASSRECFYLNGVISFFAQANGTAQKILVKYDIETQTYTYKSFSTGPWTDTVGLAGTKQVGNMAYMIAGSNSTSGAIKGILSLYDIETETFTQLATVTSTTGINYRDTPLIGLYDNILYIFYGNIFLGTWDLSTLKYTYIGGSLTTDLDGSAGSAAAVQLLNKVYLMGGNTSNNVEASSVIVYDLVSKEVKVMSGLLPYRLYSNVAASAMVDGTAYIIGGTSITSHNNRLNTVIKFAIKTNEFDNGTVVCQPSVKTNLTEMYSGKLATLDLGIDEVYYQSANGFAKQPAAIIKNGVATDIGG